MVLICDCKMILTVKSMYDCLKGGGGGMGGIVTVCQDDIVPCVLQEK